MAICEKCSNEAIEILKDGKFLAYCVTCGHWAFIGHENQFQHEKTPDPNLEDLLDLESDISEQRTVFEVPGFDNQSEEVPIEVYEKDPHNIGFRCSDAPKLELEGAPQEVLTNDI